MEYSLYYKSPIGLIKLDAMDEGITGLNFVDALPENETLYADEDKESDNFNGKARVLNKCVVGLDEYFRGERKTFDDIPVIMRGTVFRKKAWKELIKIEYGQTISYKELAVRIGNPKAVRAVGGANHNNNISIIIPCHRVIGADGSLTGYGGGLWRKEWLLEHEKKNL